MPRQQTARGGILAASLPALHSGRCFSMPIANGGLDSLGGAPPAGDMGVKGASSQMSVPTLKAY